MSERDVSGQLVRYLADAHSIEEQALAQLRTAPDIAGEDRLAGALGEHLLETQEHERLVRERMNALGEAPSRLKDMIMAVGGKGFVIFARSQPDTPCKLAAHAYSYEHLEIAAYELLARVARSAGDAETEAMAERIRGDEERMAHRLADVFVERVTTFLAKATYPVRAGTHSNTAFALVLGLDYADNVGNEALAELLPPLGRLTGRAGQIFNTVIASSQRPSSGEN